jgi:hypothetical protein
MARAPIVHALRRAATLGIVVMGGACSATPAQKPAQVAAPAAPVAPPPAPVQTQSLDSGAAPPELSEEQAWLRDWLGARLPSGGEVAVADDGTVRVFHTVRSGENSANIATAYLDLTESYLVTDLAKAIRRANPWPKAPWPQTGSRLLIPGTVREPFKTADEERLGWPADKSLRGIYVRGGTAAGSGYLGLLDRLVARDMNLIVLDTKDYDGLLSYRSEVPLAIETGATKNAPIADLARTIRFAHARGVRVAMRISCFEDEVVAAKRSDLSVQSIWKRPHKIGWLDPSNETVQKYAIDLATEAIDAGADEIQLDYVRYPVMGIANADFDLARRKLTKVGVITDFVHKVHEVTRARNVPLSLDIFGVVAENRRAEIEMLGQDPTLLAHECEAISPMVYPSHYWSGYQGFEVPGDHPEIVGIGTGKTVRLVRDAGTPNDVLVRPWLQAADYRSPSYGPGYIASEIRHAESAGAVGWLMWNPAQMYVNTWRAVPVVKRDQDPS